MWSTNQPKSQKLIKREKEIQNRREKRKRSRQKRRLQKKTVQVVDNPVADGDNSAGLCYVCFGDEDTPEDSVVRPRPCNCNVNLHYLCLVQMLSRLEYARTGRCTVCRQPFRCPWIIVHLRNTYRQYKDTHSAHDWLSKLIVGIAAVVGGLTQLISLDDLGDDPWTIYYLSTLIPTVLGAGAATILACDYIFYYRAYLNWRDHIEQLPWYRFTRYDPVNHVIDPEKYGEYDPRPEAMRQLILDQIANRRNMMAQIRLDLDLNFTPMDWTNRQMANDYRERDAMWNRLFHEQQQAIDEYPQLAAEVYGNQLQQQQ